MIASSNSFTFSANVFPRAPDRQELLHIPLSLSLFPFDPNANITNQKLNECPNCKSFIFYYKPQSQTSTPELIKCPFCKNMTNYIEHQSTPSFAEWKNSDPSPPITLILIDSSYLSKSCGFFDEVLKNLPSSIPTELTNYLVASFNSNFTLLTPNNKLLIFPDFDAIEIPPNAYFNAPITNAMQLLQTPVSHPIELIRILDSSLKIVGEHGRIILFLSTPPVGFHPIQTQLDLCQLSSINFNPDWASLQKKYLSLYSRVDFLIHLPTIASTDLVALKKFCEPMHSRFMVMDSTQLPQISEFIRDIIESYVIFVKVLFLNSLKSDGMSSNQVSFTKKRKVINSITFSMNSKWCKIIDFEMISMGPKKLPFQMIVNYRKLNGEAMTRVCSAIVNLSDDMNLVIKNLDQTVILKYVINQLLYSFKNKKETDIKKLINIAIQRISPIFRGYRNHVLIHKPDINEISIPDSLSKLPAYCLGALKSSAFAYGVISSNRIFYMDQLEYADLESLKLICSPIMLDVTDYLLNDFKDRNSAYQDIKYYSYLTKLYLDPRRIFILYDGFSSWIWIGTQIPQTLIFNLFGVEEFYQIVEVQPFNNEASIRLYGLIRRQIILCIENGIGHQSFLNKLIHDNSMGLPAYDEFLAMLQKSIIQGY